MNNDKSWHIISTWRNYEQKLVKKFMKKDIQSFCPRFVFTFIHDGHILSEKRLLFPSILFLYVDKFEMRTVLQTKGVNNFLYWLNSPVTVPHRDISRIYNLMNSFSNLQLEKFKMNFSATSESFQEANDDNVIVRLNTMGYKIIAKKIFYLEKEESIITGERYKLPAFSLNNSLNLASI
jgi:transcription termination factor NusG